MNDDKTIDWRQHMLQLCEFVNKPQWLWNLLTQVVPGLNAGSAVASTEECCSLAADLKGALAMPKWMHITIKRFNDQEEITNNSIINLKP